MQAEQICIIHIILPIDIQQESHEYILIESDEDEFDNIQSNTDDIQKQNTDIKKEVIDQESISFIFNPLTDNVLWLNLSIRHQTQYLLGEAIQESWDFCCNHYSLKMNFHDGKRFKLKYSGPLEGDVLGWIY